MFHDQHVLTNGMYLPFCFFLCSFPVQSGGSLIIIPAPYV